MQVTTVKRPSFMGNVVSDKAGGVGDTGETVIPSTKLRASEAFDSALVKELPAGTEFEVVEAGEVPNRIRVTTSTGHAGWISKATEQGKPLVKWVRKRRTSFNKEAGGAIQRNTSGDNAAKSTSGEVLTKDGLSVGDICETVIQGMTLRESEDVKSAALGQIPQGTQFEIMSIAPASRVKVHLPNTVLENGAVGWINSHTDTGMKLFKVTKAGPSKKRKSLNLAGSLSIPLGAGPDKATVEAVPPGMRRSLVPVRESQTTVPMDKPFMEAPSQLEAQDAPEASETQDALDAKAKARARAQVGARRSRAPEAPKSEPAPPGQPKWWARLVCCSQ